MSECDPENNQSTHIRTVQKLKNCYPLRFWRPHTGIYYQVLLFRRKKMKMFKALSWAKNTARGVRFLLRFNMYLFLAQCEQVYLFLALAQKISENTRRSKKAAAAAATLNARFYTARTVELSSGNCGRGLTTSLVKEKRVAKWGTHLVKHRVVWGQYCHDPSVDEGLYRYHTDEILQI